MKYTFLLLIMFPCAILGMEDTDQQNALSLASHHEKNQKSDLNLDVLPDDMIRQILLELVDLEALTVKDSKKYLVPLKRINKHFFKLIEEIEEIMDSSMEINFWEILKKAEEQKNQNKIDECKKFIKSIAEHQIEYKDCIPKKWYKQIYRNPESDDNVIDAELDSILTKRDQQFIQTVPSEYQIIATNLLSETRNDRKNNLDFRYRLTHMCAGMTGVIAQLLICSMVWKLLYYASSN